jgi:hypothetical protein
MNVLEGNQPACCPTAQQEAGALTSSVLCAPALSESDTPTVKSGRHTTH